MGGNKTNRNVDPLFQLFEHYLLTRSYEDSAAFTKEVANEYLGYLDSTQAHIPLTIRQSVLEDLEAEAHEMLVKKMYGVVRITDYLNYGKVIKVNKEDLSTFDFTTPRPKDQTEESGDPKK